MVITSMIHKADVYFDVFEPEFLKENSARFEGYELKNMHHGEIYIYLNQIYLYDGERWYRADIKDIKEIHSIASQKKILIQFWNFDLVLYCKEYSHLLALRDFLYLSQNNDYIFDNFMISEPEATGGGYYY